MGNERIRAVAPGRVNLIGDHTDHTGGWVLPMAIDRWTTVELEETDDGRLRLGSDAAEGDLEIDLPVRDPASSRPDWGRYVAAVAREVGRRQGATGRITSTVPVGGGLSSSASLLVASALALGAPLDGPLELARLCQRAEHAAVGVPCGIMDPLASIAGRAGHALLIDTTTGAVEPVALPEGVEVVVVDSGVRRSLAGSSYAEVRRRCEAAAALVDSIRDADTADFEGVEDLAVAQAGRHVASENRRVRLAAEALDAGDLSEVGRLMRESHASLRDDLGVSTREVDALVDELGERVGVHGARMTGAGFGGWIVALCDPGGVPEGMVVRSSEGAAVSRG